MNNSKVFGLYNLGNIGTIYKDGKNWTWSRFVGSGVSGNLKTTISHPNKGVKSSWTQDPEI